jgi:hypothetical protein
MRYSSNLSFPAADDERSNPRDRVHVPVRVRELGSVAFDALITDISPAGCRIRNCPLSPRAEVWLVIGDLEPVRARVAWSAKGECGCQFYKPLRRHEVMSLREGRTAAGRARLFTPGSGPR